MFRGEECDKLAFHGQAARRLRGDKTRRILHIVQNSLCPSHNSGKKSVSLIFWLGRPSVVLWWDVRQQQRCVNAEGIFFRTDATK